MPNLAEAPRRQLPEPGELLLREGLAAEALPFLLEAERRHPGDWKPLCNLGTAYRVLGRFSDALAADERGFALAPDAAELWGNYANLLDDMGRFDEALLAHRRAHVLAPSSQQIGFNLSTSLLRKGHWQDGWPLWEFGRFCQSWYPMAPIRVWERDDLKGQRILVLKEGGYGDTFHYLRYLKRLCDLGGEVDFEVWDRQAEVLTNHPWGFTVRPASKGVPLYDYNYMTSLLSVMAVLKDEPDGVRCEEPYLWAKSPQMVSRRPGTKLAVGLCWAAEENKTARPFRSVPLEALIPLADLPITWVCLQHPVSVYPELRIAHTAISNWADTMNVIAGLDLVISVDTAVAHLAAAMGKPTWIMLPVNSDWRWLLGRDDSVWYEQVELFRQTLQEGWSGLIERVSKALEKVA